MELTQAQMIADLRTSFNEIMQMHLEEYDDVVWNYVDADFYMAHGPSVGAPRAAVDKHYRVFNALADEWVLDALAA